MEGRRRRNFGLGQAARERFDGGELVGQLGRKIAAQPFGELARETDQLGRAQSVAGERLGDVDFFDFDFEQLGEAIDEPCLDGLRAGDRTSAVARGAVDDSVSVIGIDHSLAHYSLCALRSSVPSRNCAWQMRR